MGGLWCCLQSEEFPFREREREKKKKGGGGGGGWVAGKKPL